MDVSISRSLPLPSPFTAKDRLDKADNLVKEG